MRKLLIALGFASIFTACDSSNKEKKDKEVTDNKKIEIPEIPLEDFFKNPDKSSFSISPNGEYVLYKAPFEKRMNVFVQKIGDTTAQRVTEVTDRDILWAFWASDDRILYMKDDGGDG